MSGITTKKKGRRQGSQVNAVASATGGLAATDASSQQTESKKRGRPARSIKKKKQQGRDNRKSPPANSSPAIASPSPRASPPSLLSPACAVSVSSSLTSVAAPSPATAATPADVTVAPPVLFNSRTRPASLIEFDMDAFKVDNRSDIAARKGKSRAVNNLVETILGEHCSKHYSKQQLVLALHTASKDPRVRPFFKSAGLADVEDLAAMRFHHEQINRILKTTNDSKKKGSTTDDVRSYEQSIYSAMAESPISSNRTTTVPSIACRTRLFPGIPKNTLTRCMSRGKAHRKKMRENTGTLFGRVLKRLGRSKVTAELHAEFLVWLDKHNMVIQSPLASDTLLVPDGTTSGVKKRVNKILLQIPVRELHNDLIDADPLIC